jgi:hypothetical protein
MRRATTWLSRHGFADTPPTPLIAARLAIRRMATMAVVVVGVAVVAYITTANHNGRGPAASTPQGGFFVAMLLGVFVHWARQRGAALAERRISARLGRRVAHPTLPDWRMVIAPWRLITGAALNAVAFGIGAVVAAFATTAADRTAGLVLMGAVAATTAVTAVQVADVLRRPALADDAMSLAFDDVLRTEDARAYVVSVFPAIFVAFTVMALTDQMATTLRPLVYALIIATTGAAVWSSLDQRPARRPGVPTR